MKTLLKQNFTLVLGIALPFLLVIFLMLAQFTARLTIEPPQYDVVYMTQSNYAGDYSATLSTDGRLELYFMRPKNSTDYNPVIQPESRIFIFNPRTETVQSFVLDVPQSAEPGIKIAIAIPEPLKNLNLTTNQTAPDGYVFRQMQSYNGNFMTELFGGYRNRFGYELYKNGLRIAVPGPLNYYGHQQVFVGWTVNGGAQ